VTGAATRSGCARRQPTQFSAALGYISAQPVLVDGFDRVARTLFNLMRR